MPRYSLDFTNVASGVSDTPKTVAAIQTPNTAGARVRVVGISVGCSETTPVDKPLMIDLNRVQSVTGGGAGTSTPVAGSAMHKYDPGAADSVATGGVDYSAEPTVYDTESAFAIAANSRASVLKEWAVAEAPAGDQDSIYGLRVWSRDGTPAVVSGTIEFETY